MTNTNAAQVDRLAQVILFTEWRRKIAHGWAGKPLLMNWRHRLAGAEFMATPGRELMALEVADALAWQIAPPTCSPGTSTSDHRAADGYHHSDADRAL